MKIFANLQPGQNFVPHAVYLLIIYDECTFKGIVSRDFEGLQMILMDRIGVPDVPLEVYSFLNLHLHIAF